MTVKKLLLVAVFQMLYENLVTACSQWSWSLLQLLSYIIIVSQICMCQIIIFQIGCRFSREENQSSFRYSYLHIFRCTRNLIQPRMHKKMSLLCQYVFVFLGAVRQIVAKNVLPESTSCKDVDCVTKLFPNS